MIGIFLEVSRPRKLGAAGGCEISEKIAWNGMFLVRILPV